MTSTIQNPDNESTVGNVLDNRQFEKILNEIDSELVLPHKKPTQQFLLCPVGLVGAGKSTVVKPLSEKLGLVCISTDRIRKSLLRDGYNLVRTREIAFQLIEKYIKMGYSVAIDADCAGKIAQEKILAYALQYNLKTVWIHIHPPESFIINKLQSYNHTWLFKNAEEAIAVYKARKQLHEDIDIPFVYTFDTSKLTLDTQVNEALIQIHNYLHT